MDFVVPVGTTGDLCDGFNEHRCHLLGQSLLIAGTLPADLIYVRKQRFMKQLAFLGDPLFGEGLLPGYPPAPQAVTSPGLRAGIPPPTEIASLVWETPRPSALCHRTLTGPSPKAVLTLSLAAPKRSHRP